MAIVQERLRRHFDWRGLVVALAATVCVLVATHIPREAMPKVLQQDLLDKIEHVAAYGVISFLFVRSLRKRAFPSLAALLLVLAVIGALDELTQPLVNRCASVVDYAADVIGISLGCVVSLLWGARKRHTRSA